jgi:hypothetical protein
MTGIWEIDFYSRPIVDEQQKKLWELLVCDATRSFEFTKFCSGAEANARWLQVTLQEAITQWQTENQLPEGAKPEKIRFFRRPMIAIISRACEALEIPAQPSRRTFAMVQWLQERSLSVYPEHPGFQAQMPTPAQFEPVPPQPLPDALMGESWSLVSLSFEALQELPEWDVQFRDGIPLSLIHLPQDAIVPGLVVYSRRAVPLAGWMSGLEVAGLDYQKTPQSLLVLETGLNDRWILANLNRPALQEELTNFMATKQQSKGIHFVAIQESPEVEFFAGFWLLQDLSFGF